MLAYQFELKEFVHISEEPKYSTEYKSLNWPWPSSNRLKAGNKFAGDNIITR